MDSGLGGSETSYWGRALIRQEFNFLLKLWGVTEGSGEFTCWLVILTNSVNIQMKQAETWGPGWSKELPLLFERGH